MLIGQQRYLGVDNEVALVWQVHHHVRAQQLAVAVPIAALGVVFHALTQAGFFQHPLQDQFPPVTLDFLVTFECPGEVGSFLGDLAIQVLERLDLAAQGLPVLGLGGVNVLHPFAEVL